MDSHGNITRRTLVGLSAAFTVAVISAVPAIGATPVAPTSTGAASLTQVIVSGADAANQVRRAGGHVLVSLPLADAVLAELPAGLTPAGTIVVPNRALHLTASSIGGLPAYDAGALLSAPSDAGKGATVAVVDTGVDEVGPLRDQVIDHLGSNGNGGAQSDRAESHDARKIKMYDSYGHGTFMAGLVNSVAPAANILDVRVAADDGSTSLSDVLQGLGRLDRVADSDHVRVVLVALASDSPLPPSMDPLARALDRLQQHGLAVVVPSGNDPTTVSSPGDDPALITVGALDPGTSQVADWSGRGPTLWEDSPVDLVAPGVHMVSLAAPGSVIVTQNPDAMVDPSHLRGSGTSMAAAVTAGAAAAVAALRPDMTPGGLQAVLTDTTAAMEGSDPEATGNGSLDLTAAMSAAAYAPADAPLESSMFIGTSMPNDNESFDSWAARSWAARSWAARSWAARSWAARSWSARSWSESSWTARSWSARSWTARSWTARSWTARSWTARSWTARSWTARSWTDYDWQ